MRPMDAMYDSVAFDNGRVLGAAGGLERHHKPVRSLAFTLGTVAGLWRGQGDCGAIDGSLAFMSAMGGAWELRGHHKPVR